MASLGYLLRRILKLLTQAVLQGFSPQIFYKIACNGMKKFDCWFNQIVEESKKEFPDAKILEVVYPQGGKKETTKASNG